MKHLALLFLLFASPLRATELKGFNFESLDHIIETSASTLELHAYSLTAEKKEVGQIHTITGEPRLLNIKALSSKPFELALLRYDAGAAGTLVLMQMDRVALLFRMPGQKSWKVIGDHAIALRRFQGVRPLLELERPWKWDEKLKKIRFESFDEEAGVEYVWNEKDHNFARKVL